MRALEALSQSQRHEVFDARDDLRQGTMHTGKLETSPSIGIVIVNWNSFEVLRVCLSSLAKLEEQFSQVIVIDNCSAQGQGALPQLRPLNTKYIQLKHNIGFAKANNIAIAQLSQCEWVALVNPDVFVDQNWMKCLKDASERCREYSFFACQLLWANDPKRFDGVGDGYHMSGMAWSWGQGCRVDECSLFEKEVFAPCAAAALYRRDVFLEVGGFDEDFFCYFEDVDLAFRLRLAGYKCMLVPEAIVHHVRSATTGGKGSDLSVYYGYRNMVWCFFKNMPGGLFWVFLPLHIGLNFLTILQCAMRGQGKVAIRAKWHALKGLPRMWKKRRRIQQARVVSINQIWQILNKCLWPHSVLRNRPLKKLK